MNVIKRRQQDILLALFPPSLPLSLSPSIPFLKLEGCLQGVFKKDLHELQSVQINWQPYVVVAHTRFHVMHLHSTIIQ